MLILTCFILSQDRNDAQEFKRDSFEKSKNKFFFEELDEAWVNTNLLA